MFIRRVFIPMLALCSILCFTSQVHTQEQTCRTRCEAREVIDAYGCCAPLELPSPSLGSSQLLPDTITIADQHARPPFALRAYHMLEPALSEQDRQALIDQVIASTKRLKREADTLSPLELWLLQDSMSVMAWQIWMTLESELRVLHDTCAQSQEDEAQRAACVGDISHKLEERRTWLKLARPIWQRAQAPPTSSELVEAPLTTAIRAQAMFYQAAAELAAGHADQGFTLVKALLTFDAESPWAALATMSLADFFRETGSSQLAAPFYLKAASHAHAYATPYAYYRHGLCLVDMGDWQQGMRMFIRALETIQKEGARIEGVALLNKAVTSDIIALYAQTGVPEDAPRFFEALGVPVSLLPIYLERLRDAYLEVEREDEAAKLTKLLEAVK